MLRAAHRNDNVAAKVGLMAESWFGVLRCFCALDVGSQR